MKAREFIINIPISVQYDPEGQPVIGMRSQDSRQSQKPSGSPELNLNAVMVPPLQQDIELKKAGLGKGSPVIDKLIQDQPEVGSEADAPANNPQPQISTPQGHTTMAHKILQNIPKMGQNADSGLQDELSRIKQLIKRK